MPVPTRITELVADFNSRITFYKGPGYNETSTRINFINPFFEELGWDVENKNRQFEVIHEGKLTNALVDESGRRRRAPDYIFWYGPLRRFVVEAKKPAVPIKNNADAALQARSYGWSAQVPLAILTDFEEFAIYDTRYAPREGESANVALLNYYRCDDYATIWDDIANLFSHDAVANGSLDAYVQEKKAERPTIPVDKAFLTEINGWRRSLAINIASLNPQLDVRQLNRFVQATIDRLIFLRFCEDRGIEDDERLLRLTEGSASIYPQLVNLFQQADDRYNSGLFHFKKEANREQPDEADLRLKVGDVPLREIITRLSRGPYAFGVIPVEMIGQVYEQFLGEVITLSSSHTADVDYKPEVRKAGGVYYTPQYIVDYIIEHTVRPLLEDKTVAQVAEVRVLDPACGSGSFLIGAYDFLLGWYLDAYIREGESKKANSKRIVDLGSGQWRLRSDEKRAILLRHIYGVDIDTQAVEVTKLSLLLKMLEDDDRQTLQRSMAFERVLPDLDNNIKCGNSLIGPDFFSGNFDGAEWQRVNPFDWAAEFPNIITHDKDGKLTGGFDAVIGNPPYIRIQTMIDEPQGKAMLEYYKQQYSAAGKGNYDIYVLFVEHGLELLNMSGRLGYIVPNKFFNNKYGEPLRGLLARGQHLAEILHFGDQQVFANATTYTTLLFLTKSVNAVVQVTKVASIEIWRENGKSDVGTIPSVGLTANEWNFNVGFDATVLDRLNAISTKLRHVASRIFQGIIPGADKVYSVALIENKGEVARCYSRALGREIELEQSLLRQIVSGAEVNRFILKNTEARVIYPYIVEGEEALLIPQEELRARYPLTFNYFCETSELLNIRDRGSAKGESWYKYIRTQNISLQPKPKIAVPRLVSRLQAGYDESGSYCLDNVDVGGVILAAAWTNSYFYVLGLLNSKLINFYFIRNSVPFRGGFFSANRQYIENIPIRTLDLSNPTEKAQHDHMVQLVQRMLDLKRQAAASTLDTVTRRLIERTDREIDQLVYALYGLSEAEIKIVEAATP